MKSQIIKSMTSFDSPEKQVRASGILVNLMVFFQILNTTRLGVYNFLPDDELILRYAGDLTQYYGGRRYFINLPFCVYGLITTQFLLQIRYCDFSQLKWLEIFAVLSGLPGSSFSKIGITDRMVARRLIIFSSYFLYLFNPFLIVSVIFTFLFFSMFAFLSNLVGAELLLFATPAIILDLTWEFVTGGLGCTLLVIFSITCYYLKIRIKQANHEISRLVSNSSRKNVSNGKKSQKYKVRIKYFNLMISRNIKELNEICISINSCDKFFSIVLAGIIFLMVPTNTFYLYSLIHEKFDLILMEYFFYALFIFCCSVMIGFVLIAALIESQIKSLYPVLNSLACSDQIDLEVRFKVNLNK
jgi:hypothetical protein